MPSRLNYFLVLSLSFISCFLQAQSSLLSSRNGYWMPNSDTIRVFLVFAESVGDPRDDSPDTNLWKKGRMPKNADEYFDVEFKGEEQIESRMTQFFYEASFGKYVLLGDYYPRLVQVPYKEIKGFGDEQVLQRLDKVPGDDIITKNGYSINSGDFDRWSIPSGYGMPKVKGEDGYIDFILILWRVNSNITSADNAGSVNVSKWERPLKGKKGFMDRSRFQSKHSSGGGILQHEYSHSLYGGNNFHTGGRGAGNTTFMHAMGGWGNLSSFGSFSSTWNGWDRHRMGWQNPSKDFLISATCVATGEEVSTDFVYRQETACPGNEFYLDDFVTVGDLIRIELPYVQEENPNARKQYIWFENHQMHKGRYDFSPGSSKGLYSFIQVGKDDTTNFKGPGLYTTPLNGFGNYDFDVDIESQTLNIWKGSENPFTGINLSVIPAINQMEPNLKIARNGDTISVIEGAILREETLYTKGVQAFGRTMTSNEFVYKTHPALGTMHDAFRSGSIIAVGQNPAATPVLTWESSGIKGRAPYKTPKKEDNRVVALNGISFDFLAQLPDGRIKVRIGWDGAPIKGKQRWCGNLVAYENIILQPETELRIDLGFTAQKPVDPLLYRRDMVFSDTTVLRIKSGVSFIVGEDAIIKLERGSRLIMEEGSNLVLKIGAKIQVEAGSKLIFEKGTAVELESKSCIDLNRDAILIDNGTTADRALDSKLRIHKRAIFKGEEDSNLKSNY